MGQRRHKMPRQWLVGVTLCDKKLQELGSLLNFVCDIQYQVQYHITMG